MPLTEKEKDFAREQVKTYENMTKAFQEIIKHLEDKITGNYTLVGSDIAIGVTEDISKYMDKKEKRKPKQK